MLPSKISQREGFHYFNQNVCYFDLTVVLTLTRNSYLIINEGGEVGIPIHMSSIGSIGLI